MFNKEIQLAQNTTGAKFESILLKTINMVFLFNDKV